MDSTSASPRRGPPVSRGSAAGAASAIEVLGVLDLVVELLVLERLFFMVFHDVPSRSGRADSTAGHLRDDRKRTGAARALNAQSPIGIPGSGDHSTSGRTSAARPTRRVPRKSGKMRTQETFGAAAPGRRVLYSASWVLRAPPPERWREREGMAPSPRALSNSAERRRDRRVSVYRRRRPHGPRRTVSNGRTSSRPSRLEDGSSSNAAKSACLPGLERALLVLLMREACAPEVHSRIASSRDSRCAARDASSSAASVRHRIERRDRRVGPGADLEPRSIIVRNGFIAAARSHPSAASYNPPGRPHGDRTRAAPTPRARAWRRVRPVTASHLEVLDAMPPGAEVPALARVERRIHALPRRETTCSIARVADRVEPHLQAGQ